MHRTIFFNLANLSQAAKNLFYGRNVIIDTYNNQ